MIIAVYKKDTKEVLAVVGDIPEFLVRNDVETRVYGNDTEPVFVDEGGITYLKENAIVLTSL